MTNEELIKHLRQLGKYSEFKPNYFLLAADRIEEMSGRVEEMSGRVEVVRCEKCEWYINEECQNPRIPVSDGAKLYPDPTDFCSYGESEVDTE